MFIHKFLDIKVEIFVLDLLQVWTARLYYHDFLLLLMLV